VKLRSHVRHEKRWRGLSCPLSAVGSGRCPALPLGVKTVASRATDPTFFPSESLPIRSFTGWLPRKVALTWDFGPHADPLNLTPSENAGSHQLTDVVIAFEPPERGDVAAAISNASDSFRPWSRESATVRGSALSAIGRWTCGAIERARFPDRARSGKPISEAQAEVMRDLESSRFVARCRISA
jgi:hypothetical protein